jgi:hypothetical protein
MELSLQAAIVCVAVFILNTYALRPYLLAPGGIADLVFVFGATIAVRGLVLRSPFSLLGGLLIATAARQTALPPAAVAALAVAIDPAWRRRLERWQIPFAALTIGLPLAVYAVIRIVSHPFAGPPPTIDAMTLLGASLSLGGLAQHFARCVNVLLSMGALLIATWWLLRVTPAGPRARRSMIPNPPAAVLACLIFGLAIIIQPAVMNPAWASYNENRLSVMGLIPLVAAFGLMLAEVERARARQLSVPVASGIVGLLALGSFHHIWTTVGTSNKGQTLVLEAFVAVALLVILPRGFPRSRAPSRALGPAAADTTQSS